MRIRIKTSFPFRFEIEIVKISFGCMRILRAEGKRRVIIRRKGCLAAPATNNNRGKRKTVD